jgi:hypothetical protein
MVAALVACAVLAIVASGLVAARTWWDTRGAGPADTPNTTAPSADDRVGFIGPPPPGTPPTGPATGQLVAAASLYNSGTWVYADGRIINLWLHAGTTDQYVGPVVRQLTPSGVEAVRSFLIDGTSSLTPASEEDARDPRNPWGLFVRDGGRLMHVRDFNGCEEAGTSTNQATWTGCPGFTDPDWLPDSAWEDPVFRPFVPHSYKVCLVTDREMSPAEVLPAEAVDILLGTDNPLADRSTARRGLGLCRETATPDASALTDVMDQAGPDYVRQDVNGILLYELPSDAQLLFRTVLPHGATLGVGG